LLVISIGIDGNMYWAGTAEFSLPAALFPAMTGEAESCGFRFGSEDQTAVAAIF